MADQRRRAIGLAITGTRKSAAGCVVIYLRPFLWVAALSSHLGVTALISVGGAYYIMPSICLHILALLLMVSVQVSTGIIAPLVKSPLHMGQPSLVMPFPF
jgi:hypothetical protein